MRCFTMRDILWGQSLLLAEPITPDGSLNNPCGK
jgi:hypothetical protein